MSLMRKVLDIQLPINIWIDLLLWWFISSHLIVLMEDTGGQIQEASTCYRTPTPAIMNFCKWTEKNILFVWNLITKNEAVPGVGGGVLMHQGHLLLIDSVVYCRAYLKNTPRTNNIDNQAFLPQSIFLPHGKVLSVIPGCRLCGSVHGHYHPLQRYPGHRHVWKITK